MNKESLRPLETSISSGTRRGPVRKLFSSEIFVLLLVLAVMFLIGVLGKGTHFFNSGNLANVLRSGSIVGILGLGATCVMLVGEFDLSMGAIMAFSCVSCAPLLEKTGSELIPILLTVAMGGAVGVVNGILVTKCKIKSLMATLGMMTLMNGCAEWITKGLPTYLYNYELYMFLGKGKLMGIPVPVYFFAGLSLVLGILFTTTITGKKLYYTGANARTAYLCGVNTDRIKLFGFVMSGVCAAIAGIILCAINSQAIHTIAAGQEMTGIAVAVLGGTMLGGGRGNIVGTIIGAFIFQVLLNVLALSGLGTYAEQTLKGLVLIVVVIIYQLLNERRRRAR